MGSSHDLTWKVAPQLDRHLVFPLLEFLQERQLYNDEEILKAKIELLSETNMVDYAMDIHKSLYHTDQVPQEMVDRRVEVVARLKSLEESAAPLITFLQNAALVQELRPDKQYNIQMLSERYQIGVDQIEALYQYAKFQFECGNYSGAADYLYQYRALCTNPERSLSALWGKLAAEILMQNWDTALDELNRLKEIIDSKNFASPLNQLQNRIWLMHWSLFIFFNHENGRNGIIDLFFQDRYLNAIQTNAHHLLRYLATAVVVNKRRRNLLKDLIKVIQQEQYCYKDPITEFLECLYVNYDFEGAQKKLRECEQVILNDPFLGKHVEEGNFVTVPLRDEFLENARLFIFETYCRIHQCIDISTLAEKMNMSYEEAEIFIVNLVRSSKLDAKIDSVSGTLVMATNHINVHEQIIESLKNLNMRTYMLAKNIVEPAQVAAQASAGARLVQYTALTTSGEQLHEDCDYHCWSDGSFSPPDNGGAGYIVRNGQELVMYEAGGTKASSPFHMEALALLMGLQGVVNRGIQECIFHTDSLQLANLLRGSQVPISCDWRPSRQVSQEVMLARDILGEQPGFRCVHSNRKLNTDAHLLANQARRFWANSQGLDVCTQIGG